MDSKYGCNTNSNQMDTSRYSRPMPFIGLYIAGASLVCFLLALFDTFTGFKAIGKRPRQKFWFPCKWFGANAATLTLLAVATKLPVDLNTAMPGPHHQLTKLSGTVMLSVATAFFLPCFGNKNVEDMLSNLVALVILILTVAVNIGIQMGTGVIFTFLPEHIFVQCSMLFITINVFISAMSTEGVKKDLDTSFKDVKDKCTSVLDELKKTRTDNAKNIERGVELCKEGIRRRLYIKHTKYAREIEHAIIRSPNGSTVGVLSILSAIVLVEAEFRALVAWQIAKGRGGIASFGLHFCGGDSDYKWSVWLVLASQTLFVVLTIVPILFRWFESIRFVQGPVRELRICRHLEIELKRSKSSYKLITKKVVESFFGGGGVFGASIGSFLRGIGMVFLRVQLAASFVSRIISRSSSAPHCFIFWLFKRADTKEENKLEHVLVHLDDEEDFRDWMCTRHKKDVDKEMEMTSHPSTSPHGTDDDVHRLKKLLQTFKFNPDTSLEVDPFSGLLHKIIESEECKCIDTVLGMAAIAEKLAKVEVARIQSYSCDWIVKRQQGFEGSLLQDIRGADKFLRYIDQYGLGKRPDTSGISTSVDSHWQSFGIHEEPIKTYEFVWLFTKQLKWYSPAVYVFLHELLDSVERKLGNRELPIDEVGQYMRSQCLQCLPQVARLFLSVLTHVFVAAYHAISPSKTGTVEDDIGKDEVGRTLVILHLFDGLKDPQDSLFDQLERCYRNSSCTLREVVMSNERSITAISLHTWQEHKFFTRPYEPPFPILDRLFRKKDFLQNYGFRMFGVALACITHQLPVVLYGDETIRKSTEKFIRSLEGYWGILYYIDAVANFHNELWEPQLPIKRANADVLWKWLLHLDQEDGRSDTHSPPRSMDNIAETFMNRRTPTIEKISSWASEVCERLDHSQETLLSDIWEKICEDIRARCEEDCELTILVEDLKKQILLVIFSALLRLFPAIEGHVFNIPNSAIHDLPELPNKTDRSALIGEQLEHVQQSTWFRNTRDILQMLEEGKLLAYLTAFYRRSLTD